MEPILALHKMREISGTMEELLKTEVEENTYVRAVICQEFLPPQAVEQLRSYYHGQNAVLMEVARDFSYRKGKAALKEEKDVRKSSLEELFAAFYSYQHDGALPGEDFEKLISFVAEQVRNSCEDESLQERRQAVRQLIEFAGKCKCEEEE